MTRRRRWISALLMVLAYAWVVLRADSPVASVAGNPPALNVRLGLDRVKQAMGKDQPIGRGVVVAHVEEFGGRYLPAFNQPQFRTVKFIPESGKGEPLDHATATAAVAWGNVGLAPGVSEVHCYSASNWLGEACLRTGSALGPKACVGRVINHSWIGQHPRAPEVLRRLDQLIDQHDVIVVVGVNNGETQKVPQLLGSSYNAIAVGQYDGRSSSGGSTVDVEGRAKPDLVAPGNLTSFSAPAVSAMAARLLELADRRPDAVGIHRAQVIKAVLLAGAEKPDGWANSPDHPLADRFGAGRVRLDHSVAILNAGPTAVDVAVPATGWAFVSLTHESTPTWRITVPEGAKAVSVIAVWHRRIDGRTVVDFLTQQPRWLDTPRLADVDLELWREPAGAQPALAVASTSRIDNVEHVYLRSPAAGDYRIALRRVDEIDEPWDVAVAWRVE